MRLHGVAITRVSFDRPPGPLRLLGPLRPLGLLGLPIGYTTVQTRLNRLVKKGVAARTADRPARYSAAVSAADVRQGDLDLLVERVSEGRVAPLVAHLLERHKISAAELVELKQLVADAEKRARSPRKERRKP